MEDPHHCGNRNNGSQPTVFRPRGRLCARLLVRNTLPDDRLVVARGKKRVSAAHRALHRGSAAPCGNDIAASRAYLWNSIPREGSVVARRLSAPRTEYRPGGRIHACLRRTRIRILFQRLSADGRGPGGAGRKDFHARCESPPAPSFLLAPFYQASLGCIAGVLAYRFTGGLDNSSSLSSLSPLHQVE